MSTCDRRLEADVNLPHKTRVLRASGNNRTEGQENSGRRAGPEANAIQPEASALHPVCRAQMSAQMCMHMQKKLEPVT